MPRPRTSTPKIYFHASSGWYCANFSRVRVRLGKTRPEAEEAYRARLAEWLAGGRAAPPARRSREARGLLVSELMLAYAEARAPKVCAKQLFRIRSAAEAVGERYGATPAAEFDQLRLDEVRAGLLRRPSKRSSDKLLSRPYVNHLVKSVQAAFTWAAGRKLVPASVAMELRTLKALLEGEGGVEVPPVPPADPAAVAATLPYLSPTVRAMVLIDQLTGMRPGEVCVMRRADLATTGEEFVEVPLRGGKAVRVSAADVGGVLVWAYAPRRHKNRWRGKPRVVPIPPAAQKVLGPFLEGRAADAYLFSPRESSDALRESQGRARRYAARRTPGERYTTESYGKAVEAAARRAGVAHWTPGQLRHAAADRADDAVGRDGAAALLGHANPDMTGHYLAETFKKAARAAVASNAAAG